MITINYWPNCLDSFSFFLDGLLAIDKPFGLSTEGDSLVNLKTYEEKLSEYVKADCPIVPVTNTEKDVSGVIIYATNKDMINNVKKLTRDNKIYRKYWCITKNVPEPTMGRFYSKL